MCNAPRVFGFYFWANFGWNRCSNFGCYASWMRVIAALPLSCRRSKSKNTKTRFWVLSVIGVWNLHIDGCIWTARYDFLLVFYSGGDLRARWNGCRVISIHMTRHTDHYVKTWCHPQNRKHTISHRRQRKTEQRSQATCTKDLVISPCRTGKLLAARRLAGQLRLMFRPYFFYWLVGW